MKINIPGGERLEIKHIVSDYNGTIALDGELVEGVADLIDELSKDIRFHVITADSFGSVERELHGIDCELFKIGPGEQDRAKETLSYLEKRIKIKEFDMFLERNSSGEMAISFFFQ
ncbi:MAG: hypothetical protein B6227_04935 [Fusobacteriia bacterium 4572_74]|nr:MAG: hypothetical protein B6227_04935 [Fusobacteriia bacterium 4572_74]